jgi:hypothetical protein
MYDNDLSITTSSACYRPNNTDGENIGKNKKQKEKGQ